jgi:hypothetical protein
LASLPNSRTLLLIHPHPIVSILTTISPQPTPTHSACVLVESASSRTIHASMTRQFFSACSISRAASLSHQKSDPVHCQRHHSNIVISVSILSILITIILVTIVDAFFGTATHQSST